MIGWGVQHRFSSETSTNQIIQDSSTHAGSVVLDTVALGELVNEQGKVIARPSSNSEAHDTVANSFQFMTRKIVKRKLVLSVSRMG